MGKYSFIKDIYKAGGYKALLEEGFYRLPIGATKEMSDEEKRIWKRFLAYRWRKEHPEFVKRQNRYYSKKRQKEKPYIAICKLCGKEFHTAREYNKICPDCHKLPTKHQIHIEESKKRKKEKALIRDEVRYWYKKGLTQCVLAEDFGVTQKTISNWVNSKK